MADYFFSRLIDAYGKLFVASAIVRVTTYVTIALALFTNITSLVFLDFNYYRGWECLALPWIIAILPLSCGALLYGATECFKATRIAWKASTREEIRREACLLFKTTAVVGGCCLLVINTWRLLVYINPTLIEFVSSK